MENRANTEGTFERELEFTALTRWFHWIRAIAIFVLIVTGFYIAYPFLTPIKNSEPTNFMYALARSWHQIFGFALIAVTIFRVYLFIFDKGCRAERASFADFINPMVWFRQLRNYMLLGPHPHLKGAYNPIQLMAYIGLMLLIVLISVTGIILYYNVYHDGLGAILFAIFKPLEVMFGGLANVRAIHHITTWAFVIFIPVHIYMATWNSARYPNGGIDSIFSGFRYHKKHH